MKKLFRTLVIFSISIYLIWFVLPHFWGLLHTPEEVNLLNYNGYGESFNALPLIYTMAVLYVISAIGLFIYSRWARTLFLGLTAFAIAVGPFMGWSVQTGFEASINHLAILCDGAVIFMSYFSSVRDEFSDPT